MGKAKWLNASFNKRRSPLKVVFTVYSSIQYTVNGRWYTTGWFVWSSHLNFSACIQTTFIDRATVHVSLTAQSTWKMKSDIMTTAPCMSCGASHYLHCVCWAVRQTQYIEECSSWDVFACFSKKVKAKWKWMTGRFTYQSNRHVSSPEREGLSLHAYAMRTKCAHRERTSKIHQMDNIL